ncbi:hypothetical protein ABPG72_017533 [Tetrahymena utriculariae]
MQTGFEKNLQETLQKKLYFTQLSSNYLGNQGVSDLGYGLGSSKNLIYLKIQLKENYIQDIGVQNFCKGLGNCKTIQRFVLQLQESYRKNCFTNERDKSIGQCLEQFQNLQVVNLSLKQTFFPFIRCKQFIRQNSVGSDGLSYLGQSISKCVKLKIIKLNLRFQNKQGSLYWDKMCVLSWKLNRYGFYFLQEIQKKILL